TLPGSSPVVPVGSPVTMTNSWWMLPLLVTTNAMTPAFNSVALGCRYISPSSTVTARTRSVPVWAGAVMATGAGLDAEVWAIDALASSSVVRSSRLSRRSVDATSTNVTTIVMTMVLNNVSWVGSVDFTYPSDPVSGKRSL